MNKREAREILFTLVYEYEFNREKSAVEIYNMAREERGFDSFRYIKKGLADIVDKRDYLCGVIEKRSDGWKISRMAPVTRSILMIAVYDMACKNLPCEIAINEAVELAKKYDESASAAFVNGVLNKVSRDLGEIRVENTAQEFTEDQADIDEDAISEKTGDVENDG